MTTITFSFKDEAYSALVEERFNDHEREFRVTIMNGELEQQFYGEHIIKEKDCVVNTDRGDANINLRSAIIQAIYKTLLQKESTV